jgi:diaminopimelate epimerase
MIASVSLSESQRHYPSEPGIANSMQVKFVKMHGIGNDFMLVEWPAGRPPPEPGLVRAWGDRRRGVGFDSLLLVERGGRYRVFNADGGEAEQCGNGARCIAAYLADGSPTEIELTSVAGPVGTRVLERGIVAINLGEPDFRPESLPFAAEAAADSYRLELASGPVEFGIVSMGNPHAVIAVDSVDTARVGIIGAELAAHPAFAESVNVGFAERVGPDRIRLRVYERGIGETLACGTGAAAAVATGRRRGQLEDRVAVELPGGVLEVEWAGAGADLWQTGQTTKVYEGLIEI